MTDHRNTPKPIETHYAGCRFRSRLEARWAVFMDHLGIEWQYEPEGFELEPLRQGQNCVDGEHVVERVRKTGCPCTRSLGMYLPDFYLPSLNTWFEVKGTREAAVREEQRLWRFQELAGKRVVVAIGSLPDPRALDIWGHPPDCKFELERPGDGNYAWCSCPWCGKFGIEFEARGARVCGYRQHGVKYEDKACNGDDERIAAAYRAARSARFEYGESG